MARTCATVVNIHCAATARSPPGPKNVPNTLCVQCPHGSALKAGAESMPVRMSDLSWISRARIRAKLQEILKDEENNNDCVVFVTIRDLLIAITVTPISFFLK